MRCVHVGFFSPFTLVRFPGVPADANIWYAHPYVVDDDLMLIMPISFESPEEDRSGIFYSIGRNTHEGNLEFSTPVLLKQTPAVAGVTEDVIAYGGAASSKQLCLLLHRRVSARMFVLAYVRACVCERVGVPS